MTSDSGKLELYVCVANVAAGFVGALADAYLMSAMCYGIAALALVLMPSRKHT